MSVTKRQHEMLEFALSREQNPRDGSKDITFGIESGCGPQHAVLNRLVWAGLMRCSGWGVHEDDHMKERPLFRLTVKGRRLARAARRTK